MFVCVSLAMLYPQGIKGQRLHKHCVSNFDRLVDPKGEGAARIIPLGSTKQLKKLHLWVRLFIAYELANCISPL
jgi:hypothetical protein